MFRHFVSQEHTYCSLRQLHFDDVSAILQAQHVRPVVQVKSGDEIW